MKILTTNGEIVEKQAGNVVYLAMFKKDGFWSVAGVFYHSPEDAEAGMAGMAPNPILLVRVYIPEEAQS